MCSTFDTFRELSSKCGFLNRSMRRVGNSVSTESALNKFLQCLLGFSTSRNGRNIKKKPVEKPLQWTSELTRTLFFFVQTNHILNSTIWLHSFVFLPEYFHIQFGNTFLTTWVILKTVTTVIATSGYMQIPMIPQTVSSVRQLYCFILHHCYFL